MVTAQEYSRIKDLLGRIVSGTRRVCVMGSANVDYTVTTEELPLPGQTVNGGPLQILPGGKSANQAASAGRIGARVSMLGMVGQDDNVDFLLRKLSEAHVDTSHMGSAPGPSGSTVITVDSHGENTIVYSAGSNAQVSPDYVQANQSVLQEAAVLGLCLESPLEAVMASATICHNRGIPVLLNDSPFLADLPRELIGQTDILLVNEHELADLLRIEPELVAVDEQVADGFGRFHDQWEQIRSSLAAFGYQTAIVTLGSHGAVVLNGSQATYIRPVHVQTVDTTGCGDSFMGTILSGIAAGLSLTDSAYLASYVAAYAATGIGAQASYGSSQQILNFYSPVTEKS